MSDKTLEIDPTQSVDATTGARPLTEQDVRRIFAEEFAPISKKIDALTSSFDSFKEETFTKTQINKIVEIEKKKFKEEIDRLDQQNLDTLEAINKLGTNVESVISGFTNQVKAANISLKNMSDSHERTSNILGEAAKAAKEAIEIGKGNALTISGWGQIIHSTSQRTNHFETRMDNLDTRVRKNEELQLDTDERMTLYVAKVDSTFTIATKNDEKIVKLDEEQDNIKIAIQSISDSVTSIKETFSVKNIASIMIIFASLIGVESGALQRAVETFGSLFH